jgi:crotonobetainyl-CoA:carnitine CoA-transferase CaiB-like acyl-CoA transferase
MHQPLKGFKVVEVAQFTFTPSAGAVLAEWGADVIKVEHAERGDAQRGDISHTRAGRFHPIMDHPNRGKRSIGIAIEHPEGHDLLMDLCRDADVFLINFLPEARRRLKLEVDDVRKANPRIIYVRGSAHGQRGPWAEKGGYDGSVFWARMGSAWGVTPPDSPRVIFMPAGAYGDSMGGMTIAGGIAGALLGRERTGEPSVVDVSLMSVGAWAFGMALADTALSGHERSMNETMSMSLSVNPTVGHFRTSDGRWINFTMIQAFRFFPDVCRHLGLEHLIDDERFNSSERLLANAAEAGQLIADVIAKQPFSYWLEHLVSMEGPWAPVQSPLEILDDPQMEANGYIRTITDADGEPRTLIANPVQFDETPPESRRGPLFAEHTDEIVRSLGRSEDELLQLKIDGAIT